jgi:hypothetical protein
LGHGEYRNPALLILQEKTMTAENLIGELWRRCLTDAREAGNVPAGAVQKLIEDSREILTEYGCSKRNADVVLFDLYTMIHWDGDQPTDRVFETLLEIELTEFFSERGIRA